VRKGDRRGDGLRPSTRAGVSLAFMGVGGELGV
jgi:hypothetical protein